MLKDIIKNLDTKFPKVAKGNTRSQFKERLILQSKEKNNNWQACVNSLYLLTKIQALVNIMHLSSKLHVNIKHKHKNYLI